MNDIRCLKHGEKLQIETFESGQHKYVITKAHGFDTVRFQKTSIECFRQGRAAEDTFSTRSLDFLGLPFLHSCFCDRADSVDTQNLFFLFPSKAMNKFSNILTLSSPIGLSELKGILSYRYLVWI